ncbi:MAG: DUF4919 domain-containing protein [Bacteroidales bacterium]|nr:DUF4919 domain-containing protein [Bacteroidales bacterium]
MKHSILFFLLATAALLPSAVTAQQNEPALTRYKEFKQVLEAPLVLDTVKIDDMLAKWEAEEPQAVELQSAKFQYLLKKALLDIEMAVSPLDENTAMLPAIPGLYENLQITNHWILKDKGHAMENYAKAYEILDKAIAEHPERLDLLAWKMDGYMQKFEHRRGMLTAFEMLQKSRENGHNWTMLYGEKVGEEAEDQLAYEGIISLLDHNEFSLAQIMIDSLQSYNPKTVCRIANGLLLECKMQPDSAVNIYKELEADFPNNPELQFRILNNLIGQGKNDEARPYAQALAANPDPDIAARGKEILAEIEPIAWQYEAMEQWMQANAGEYEAIRNRFVAGDETLTRADLVHLYYGQAFTEGYSLFAFRALMEAFNKEADYEKCLTLCKAALEKTPAAFTALFYGAMSARQMNDNDVFKNYALRLRQISQMIMSLGNGSDMKHAMPVLWVDEEYSILSNVGQFVSQTLYHTDEGDIDCLVFASDLEIPAMGEDGQITVENKHNEQQYYFNISYSSRAMSKELSGHGKKDLGQ